MTRRNAAFAAAIVLLGALAGCSLTRAKKVDQPTELKKITEHFKPKRVWSVNLGKGEPKLLLGLSPAIDGNHVYGANPRGDVVALDLASGRRQWQKHLKLALSGGPGVGGGLVVVGGNGGTLVALAASNGAERWRVQLNAELLAAPAIAGDLVVVRTVDGKLFGLEAADGKRRWLVDQQVPRLTLRGNSQPVIAGEMAISGFDNGRLIAVALATGNTAWDVAVGQARGSSELQRLVDIDSRPLVDGDDVFTAAFQGRAVRLERDTGTEIWSREISSYRGLAADSVGVFVSTADGMVTRLDRATGIERWHQTNLLRRELTAPAVQGKWVVVADIEGVIHWLSAEDGSFQARAKGGDRINSAPQVVGDLVLVQTDKGAIEAWRAPRQ